MEPTKDSHTYSAPDVHPFKNNPYSYLSHPKFFLDYVASKLGWDVLLSATILDVGCGTVRPQLGEWFYAKFTEMSHVVALDKDPGVINQCRREYDGVAPIQFVVGGIDEDLEQISLTEEWIDKFDKVMSLNCFHLVPDLISAFDNLYLVTKPDGEIAVAFCLWSGFIEIIDHVTELKKWDDYERDDAPKAPCLQDSEKDVSAFEEMIRKRGFTILQCEKIEVEQPYESEEECKKDLLQNALLAYDIPTEHLSEFSDDVYKCFLKCSERIGDGQKVARSTYLMVLAQKYGSTLLFSDSTTDSATSSSE